MTKSKTELEARAQDLAERLQAMQQVTMIAQQNELNLFRRLAPYLDAEIQNRDAEIEELKTRVEDLVLEEEPKAKLGGSADGE